MDLIADLGTRRLTWRRLTVLLNHLPRESAYVRAVAGDAAAWGDTEYLLAGLIDAVKVGNYVTEIIASNRRINGQPKPPTPLQRPGDKPERGNRIGGKHRYTQAQMRKILDNWGTGDVIETEAREVT